MADDPVDTGCGEIPDTDRCTFIESGACNTDGRIDFLHFYCCTMEHLHWLAIILFVRSSLDLLVRASREILLVVGIMMTA